MEVDPIRRSIETAIEFHWFFNDDGSRARGMLMHEIVSSIKTVSDLSGALQRRVMEGELTETEQKEVFEEITEMLSLPEVSDWYSGNISFLTRCKHSIRNGDLVVPTA